ncbi:hypothetical protein ACOSQ3_032247 [Xanthoceras sorbifolium]
MRRPKPIPATVTPPCHPRPASSDSSLRRRRTSKTLRKRAVFWNQTARRSDLQLLFLNQTARTSKALRKHAIFWV